MTRTEARETAMQMLFQMETQEDFSPEAKNTFLENFIDETDQLEYINQVYDAYSLHSDEIDGLIEDSVKGWKLERLAKVDLAVIRLCIAEFKYKEGESVPVNVAISEAVKMAKKFGGDDSGKFVNGILGGISRKND